MLQPHAVVPIPVTTAEVARAAFPQGNVYMKMRDELGVLYADSEFAALFAARGRPAEAPGRLALVLVFQHMEGLSDRQAADNVRRCLDWKYALGLELTDPGFDYSVLSEFRDRLLAGSLAQRLLDDMLAQFQARGWLKARGRQRTDSTHILAATRKLNRLECVGETLRRTLNDLTRVAPEWVLAQVTPDWFDLYGSRIEQYRLPKGHAAQVELAERIGRDGAQLLQAVAAAPDNRAWLQQLPALEVLCQVWAQQYTQTDAGLRWRTQAELPPYQELVQTPYDVAARNRTKRDLNWTGYAAHVTETCAPDTLHVITHVETTPATTSDSAVTETIHAALDAKGLPPKEHYVDTGYVSAAQLVNSHTAHEITLVGPVPRDTSWQARAQEGYDSASFAIDWEQQSVTCPQGQTNHTWRVRQDPDAPGCIEVRMPSATCAACPVRAQCTQAKTYPRTLKLRPQAQHEALQQARQHQTTASFKADYQQRAGVEGTISQGVRAFALRRTRYIGLAKTHLQHILTAAAINLTRLWAWLEEIPLASTRQSPFATLARALQPA
ncbi:MAG: IS1182 family transposase [Gammaproteobacteria bacterium]|nr:IS1182 family transposase [Gammaproteobacteria bacterium]